MEIQPDKQNLDQTFATTVYFIDFYQRDYKWTEEPVNRLLDDIFYQFDEAYQKYSALEPNKENINARYPWYYLNTYVTNTVGGRVFVVDGQQRLTTLTLILLKLHSTALELKSKTVGWLERKIAGYSGTEHEFWMNHVRHRQVLKSYANTLYWNETLREDCYKSKLDFRQFMQEHSLNFKPLKQFGPEELEERQKLLFDLCRMIWPTPPQEAK
jgi:hypothetical protein